MSGPRPAACALAALALFASGCLARERCQTDLDCPRGELCSASSGACVRGCAADDDCRVGGLDVGRICVRGRCEDTYFGRAPAPSLCDRVVNPASTLHGKQVCLSDFDGDVVVVLFHLLGCAPCGQEAELLQRKMLEPLVTQGYSGVQFISVSIDPSVAWPQRAVGFDTARFPVLIDTAGAHYTWGAFPHELFLVDRWGRLVSKEADFSVALSSDPPIERLLTRIKELHGETSKQ